MKRAILVAAVLLAGVVGAQADIDVWSPMARHNDLNAATDACDSQVGVNQNGVPTSARYKACMVRQGWRYQRTKRIPTWIDPDTGDRCHNEGIATVCCWPCRDGG